MSRLFALLLTILTMLFQAIAPSVVGNTEDMQMEEENAAVDAGDDFIKEEIIVNTEGENTEEGSVDTEDENTEEVIVDTEGENTGEEAIEDNEDNYVEVETPAVLYAELADQNVLNQLESYAFVSDAAGSEYATKVMFTISGPVTGLKYSAFTLDFTIEGEMIITEKKELLSLDTFGIDDIFVAELEFLEFMPNHCIEYTEPDGTHRCYLLSESGMDGSPVLSAYEE